MTIIKVCPVVFRRAGGGVDLLAFVHPCADRQFVKGSVNPGEPLEQAAKRELHEESGLRPGGRALYLGEACIGDPPAPWHFFAFEMNGLPETWLHETEDDKGHIFSFFWQPLEAPLDANWHSIFHKAYRHIRSRLTS